MPVTEVETLATTELVELSDVETPVLRWETAEDSEVETPLLRVETAEEIEVAVEPMPDRLSYLKQAIVNRSRSVLRHRSVADRNAPRPAPGMPSAEQDAISMFERGAVISALRALPDRQQQALVLRYYADLSEAQIAEMMGISKGAVKSHTARGSHRCAVLERTA